MKLTRQPSLEEYFTKLQKQRISKQTSAKKQKVQVTPNKNKDNTLKPPQNPKQKIHQQQKQKSIVLSVSGSEVQQVQIAPQVLKKQQKQRQVSNEKKRKVNIQFYLNKIPSDPHGDLIDKIHDKWWSNYGLLQQHHGFIQWLFPNSFQSRFNRLAMPLTEQEAKQFRNNQEIANRYLKSYQMMLQFYGIRLKSKQTGQLTRCRHGKTHVNIKQKQQEQISSKSGKKPFYEQRFYKTFLTSFHNHMRITRILSSLVMCGFGRYAKQFSLFLNEQINGEKGALKQLKKYGVYQREWKQYSGYIQNKEDVNVLLKSYKH